MSQDGRNGGIATSAPLTLRVRGGPRDGQIVKLTAAKCTIGSSRGCTLRLHGKGIRPVHCVIVRGKAQTVVRRWSTDTLLNGQTFDDKQLVFGDLIRCGPVEFEVVPESGQSCQKNSPTPFPAAMSTSLFGGTQVIAPGGAADVPLSGTQVLPASMRQMPTGTQLLSGGTQVLPNATQLLPGRADAPAWNDGSRTVPLSHVPIIGEQSENLGATVALSRAGVGLPDSGELERRESEIAKREQADAEKNEELESRTQALRDRESELARQEADLQQREERLRARENEIEQQTTAAATPSASPQSSAGATETNGADGAGPDETRQKLAAEREAIEKSQREADAQHALREAEHKRWQEDHRQWKAQRKAAEDQMEGLHAQVEHQLAEIMSRRKNLDQDRDAWKTESEIHRRQLEDRAAEVARQAEEVERWRKELDAERQKAAKLIEETSRYEQLRAELADTQNVLATREQELAAARRELGEVSSRAERKPDDVAEKAAAAYREKLAQLEQQAEELLRIRTELERDRTQWDAERRQAAEFAASSPSRRSGEADAAATKTRATDSPSNLSTWALLKDRIDVPDDEPAEDPAPQSASHRAEPLRSEPIGDDEESIERYMASLMDRVGGRSTSTPTSPPATDPLRDSSPRSELAARAEERPESETKEPERPRPVVRKAQTVTPEDVAAMRELANLNARVALTRHGAKQMIPNIFAKATMTTVAWILAIAIHMLNTKHQVLPLIGAAACALVGAMFLARTLTTVSQLFASRRAAMPNESNDDVADGPKESAKRDPAAS